MKSAGLKRHFLPVSVFLLSFLIFNSNLSWLPGGDSVPNRYMPFSIICDGDFDLTEFTFLYTLEGRESLPYYLTKSVEGEIVSIFGMGVPLFSLPFYLVAMMLRTDFSYNDVLMLSKITASSVSALGVLFCFLALSLFVQRRRAITGTAVYAFGTLVFSICSQGLYQHTFAVFFLTSGFYFFLKGVKEKGAPSLLSALLFAFAVLARPQCSIFFTAFLLLSAVRHRGALWKFIFGSYPVFLLLAAYNSYYFDSPFSFGQIEGSRDIALYKTGSAELFRFNPEGIAGLLFSPSRGFFVYSPIFLMLPFAIYRLFGRNPPDYLKTVEMVAMKPALFTALSACAAYLLFMGCWYDWWGGWTFGYRQATEVIPFVSIILGITVEELQTARIRKALAISLLSLSIFIQSIGVYIYDIYGWHELKDIDRNPGALWSVRESQIIYYLENFRIRDYNGFFDIRNPTGVKACETSP